jgi:hypothetical protein
MVLVAPPLDAANTLDHSAGRYSFFEAVQLQMISFMLFLPVRGLKCVGTGDRPHNAAEFSLPGVPRPVKLGREYHRTVCFYYCLFANNYCSAFQILFLFTQHNSLQTCHNQTAQLTSQAQTHIQNLQNVYSSPDSRSQRRLPA